ncbi:MAG: glutamyl-tRNA reductase [Tannerella sp.]|jgi:glutamyl-tRNA reductase|nr:glutamyl-tRNA reductase [Tannerella sp.]
MIKSKLINHSQYSLEEREQLSGTLFIDESIPHVLLSTCNRIELYWGDGAAPENIIRHLYRVASGLESALLGERAIQGQLKTAYMYALDKYCLPPSLNRLFQTAIHTGKRTRNETRISEGAISHSQITTEILKSENVDLRNKTVSIIGVNKLTENILKYLVARGAINIFLSNRNIEKARVLAAKYNGTAIHLDKKVAMLNFTDVLICATSAPHTIIHKNDLPQDKKMLIFDLAFPRDVDENVREIASVKLFDLEDVEAFASRNLIHRNNEVNKVERIIDEEIASYYRWQNYNLNK